MDDDAAPRARRSAQTLALLGVVILVPIVASTLWLGKEGDPAGYVFAAALLIPLSAACYMLIRLSRM